MRIVGVQDGDESFIHSRLERRGEGFRVAAAASVTCGLELARTKSGAASQSSVQKMASGNHAMFDETVDSGDKELRAAVCH